MEGTYKRPPEFQAKVFRVRLEEPNWSWAPQQQQWGMVGGGGEEVRGVEGAGGSDSTADCAAPHWVQWQWQWHMQL